MHATHEPPAVLLVMRGCDTCEDSNPDHLYVTTKLGRLCSKCWKAVGCPFDPLPVHPQLVQQTQLGVRERMIARGGRDRYLVKAGKT